MGQAYWRPIVEPRSDASHCLAGGWAYFSQVERIERGGARQISPVEDAPKDVVERLCAPRRNIAGLSMQNPQIMAIINATPDSFSDGGDHVASADAIVAAEHAVIDGANLVDIGGESTRPNADFINESNEITRVLPVIEALIAKKFPLPISIDTRKPAVARVAVQAGAAIFNDISALSYQADGIEIAADLGIPVCLMHSAGDPKVMQSRTDYDDVVLDIYDYLNTRVELAVKAGVQREHIIIDPGIGFGKTPAQSAALTRNLSLFHGLGMPILYGGSRKSFIGSIAGVDEPKDRLPGSLVVAMEAARQGAQILRVHDVAATVQALSMAKAVSF